MMTERTFDAYSRTARLVPVVLVLAAPTIAAVALLDHRTLGIAVGVVIQLGFFVPMANVARRRGRRLQKRMWSVWGGPPLAQCLAGTASDLAEGIRRRAVARLRILYPGEQIPDDGDASDYETVAELIRHRIRQAKDAVVDAENRQYGFERNLYALRPIGILVSLLTAIAIGLTLYFEVALAPVVALAATALISGWWWFYPSEDRVREAAQTYAEAVVGYLAAWVDE